MKKILFLILFIILLASPSWAANYYINPACTTQGTGSSWTCAASDGAAGAYKEIPYSGSYASLASRASSGHVYYLGAGTLSRYLYFSTALGGTNVIEFRKATSTDHGTDTGWSASYAGQTVITAPWEFTTGYWYINGATGGGPGNWDGSSTPFGIKWLNDACNIASSNKSLVLPPLGTSFTVRHVHFYNPCPDYYIGLLGYIPDAVNDKCEYNGYGEQIGYGAGGATTNPIIEYNYFEDSFGPPIYTTAFNNGKIRYNYFYGSVFTLHCHSNSINSGGWMTDMEIAYNYFRNTDGAGIGHVIEAPLIQSDRRIHIYGNVFDYTDAPWYKSSTASTSCIDCTFHNNTIYNGMGTGAMIYLPGGSGNYAYNNIFHTCNLKYPDWTGVSTHDYNYYYDCGTFSEAYGVSGVPATDLFTSPSTHDFTLKTPGTVAGRTLADTSVSTYTTDMLGNTRSTWDRGAYEYTGSAPADIQAPSLSILSPTTASRWSQQSSTLGLGGTASDNVGVTAVTWSNSVGGSGTCSGTTTWVCSPITLIDAGDNLITIGASDAAGNTGTAIITVIYPGTDISHGHSIYIH